MPRFSPISGCSADGFAPCHEFIGAELIGFDRVPGQVENARTILLRAHAIQPVIARDEVASRIADDGNAELADLIEHIFAKAVGIGEL